MDRIYKDSKGRYNPLIRINGRDMNLGSWTTYDQAVKALWKREVFDSRVERLQPTDAEIYLKKKGLLMQYDLNWQIVHNELNTPGFCGTVESNRRHEWV